MVQMMPGSAGRFAGMVNQSTKEGYYLENVSGNDIVVDIAGVYFPIDNISYTKSMEVEDIWGLGSHLPFNLLNKQIGFEGSFQYGSFLRSKTERHALTALLEDQSDEGQPLFFNIVIMDRQPDVGAVEATYNSSFGSFVEALILCKVNTSGREYPLNGKVLTKHNFKFLTRIPR